MAQVEVITEQEAVQGWRYQIRVTRPDGRESEHEVGLSWADHEYWSGGTAPPFKVVEAVVRYLVGRERERPIPARFDAATARRWWPAIDEEMAF